MAVQPIVQQGLDRVAVGEALIRVAQVEMGVERQHTDAVETEGVDAGPGDGVVAADQDGQGAMGLSRHRVSYRLEGVERRDGLQRHVAGVVNQNVQLQPRLDVIGRQARQDSAQGLGAEIAAARRQRPLIQRRANQGDGGFGMVPHQIADRAPSQGFRRLDHRGHPLVGEKRATRS
ncbi:hypothetical protein D3C72_1806730 [compost metagenome]